MVFIDTSAIVALFDRFDKPHTRANNLLQIIREKRIRLLMSDYILDESITTALSRIGHDTAVKVGEFILNSNIIELVWLDESVKMKAWEYFKKHPDKKYSFTDCTSFVLMREMKINDFFAFDEDFIKAGFINFSDKM